MKTLVVYMSYHHMNTEKIVRAMNSVLKAKTISPMKVSDTAIKGSRLVGFGSGIYAFKHHAKLFEMLDRIKPVKNKKAFIFSTSGGKSDFHGPLRRKLNEKGFEIIAEFNCPGWDSWGPFKLVGGLNKDRPNKDDLLHAKEFARVLLKLANR